MNAIKTVHDRLMKHRAGACGHNPVFLEVYDNEIDGLAEELSAMQLYDEDLTVCLRPKEQIATWLRTGRTQLFGLPIKVVAG